MKILLTVFIVFVVYSLHAQPLISQEQQKKMKYYSANKHRNYKLKKKHFTLKDTNFVDTSSVYIHKEYDEIIHDTLYYFARFFRTGQVFISDLYLSIPTDSDCNTITYGNRGYYVINGDNMVIELYINSYVGYRMFYCQKADDSYKYIKAEPRSFPFLVQRSEKTTYKLIPQKMKVKLYSKPIW